MDLTNVVRTFLPAEYWSRPARVFIQQIEYNPLAASAQGIPGTFTIDNGFDFLCTHVTEIITNTTGDTEQTFPEHLVQISNASSGEQWTAGGFHHAANVFGRSPVNGQPTPLAWPQLVRGGQTVTVLATNLEATARRIWMGFHGVLITRLG